MFTIRPFAESDYEAVAYVYSQIMEEQTTAESMRWEDQNRDPRCRHGKWVAEQDGRLVGGGGFGQTAAFYHPQKFEVNLLVLPEFRRQGIGTALYEQVLSALAEYEPIALSGMVRETWADSMAFAQRHGFTETMRNWETHLDLRRFDPTPFAAVLDEASAKGYQIYSYAELADNPDLDRRLHALVMEVRRDVPAPEPWQDTPFETWLSVLKRPAFFGEGYFIAAKEGEFVGLSVLWRTDEPAVLSTGLTAVKREHRGSSIAKALKVRAAHLAKEKGFELVKTWNESNNQRMLAINDWLGFQRQPAWVFMGKELGAPPSECTERSSGGR